MTVNNLKKEKPGFFSAIVSGLIPHTFCIMFIIFSALGVTAITALIKPLLLSAYFFHFLIFLSFLLATVSATIYLKRSRFLSWQGIKKKWRYLSLLYAITIITNLLFFLVIFPKTANLNLETRSQALGETSNLSSITIAVQIPCSGHAPLIIDELKKEEGIKNITFHFPNLFKIQFSPQQTNQEKILTLPIFDSFPAKPQ
ncbi:MAG: hypothetical protein PHR64_00090 [Candidatus Shapirobacteria bacterium]|nr:hypothetical protein [Candidatus Shapirobacteria bacterium]MDD5073585.1 hypothetical protein [Candidatus Shapirobacteria bacterium]MDD5481338.1 hypothetical protein [Candidatus Shapirobacteria bacterium]